MSQQPNNSEISIDERLMALLEISENQRATAIQDQKFNELVETFTGLRNEIANNENVRADTFSNKATQAIIRIENIPLKMWLPGAVGVLRLVLARKARSSARPRSGNRSGPGFRPAAASLPAGR